MSSALSRWQAILLGLVVLAGLGLGGLGLFAVGSRGWYGTDALQVRAAFPEIRGVEVGTRVRVQGIDAGEVTALVPPETPGERVVLRLRLRGSFRNLVRSNATVRIVSEGLIGGKVVEILPGPGDAGAPVGADDLLASAPTAELADVLGQVSQTLQGIKAGEGALGKLATDPKAYDALLALLDQGKETMKSIQHDADAMKRLPVLRNYVEDPVPLLVRPHCERNRQLFAEAELFEPGRAVLTEQGCRRLDELAPWLSGMKHKGSEVVVVSYADPRTSNPQTAGWLTRLQSEAVCDYLKRHHTIQKTGWFSSRKVAALGMGAAPPPTPETEALPPARVEVQVFVPQG